MTFKKYPKIPIGIDDFQTLRSDNYCYVDKSMFIDEILNSGPQVTLIARPRRIGKTINMSMLRYFLDCSLPSSKPLFAGLAIEKDVEFCNRYMNSSPVIFVSFKEAAKQATWAACYDLIKKIISNLYESHNYLLNWEGLSETARITFLEVNKGIASDASMKDSLFFLCRLLKQYYKKQVYVLIDEYDAPIHTAYTKKYYDDCMDFMLSLYSAVMKGNEFLAKGVMTGILRVSKESMFSGFNNPVVYTVLQQQCSTQFGILEHELVDLLKQFDLADHISSLQNWYNGYRIGNTTSIYNPWSIEAFFGVLSYKQVILLLKIRSWKTMNIFTI
jgi:hypothetical protein